MGAWVVVALDRSGIDSGLYWELCRREERSWREFDIESENGEGGRV